MQAAKAKVSIEFDEKATEPRLLIPMQVMLGGFGPPGGIFGQQGGPPANFGAFGAAGQMGAPPGAAGQKGAFGQQGAPPANFGQQGAFGQQGGPPPGAAGQKGAFGQQGAPPGAAGQQGVFGQPGGTPPTPPPLPPGGKDEDSASQPESKRQSSLPLSTMIIGLALTLSFSTGGLWMARRKSGAKPVGLLVAILSIGLLSGAAVWANLAPPQRPPQPPQFPGQPQVPGPLPALLKLDGIKVELLPQGDTIRLILTKKQKEELKAKDAPAPEKKEKPKEEEEEKK
jgi:hypothetical protein